MSDEFDTDPTFGHTHRKDDSSATEECNDNKKRDVSQHCTCLYVSRLCCLIPGMTERVRAIAPNMASIGDRHKAHGIQDPCCGGNLARHGDRVVVWMSKPVVRYRRRFRREELDK